MIMFEPLISKFEEMLKEINTRIDFLTQQVQLLNRKFDSLKNIPKTTP